MFRGEGAGVDAPGADAEGREAGGGAFVVSCQLSVLVLYRHTWDNVKPDEESHMKQISIGWPRNDRVNADDAIAAVSGPVKPSFREFGTKAGVSVGFHECSSNNFKRERLECCERRFEVSLVRRFARMHR